MEQGRKDEASEDDGLGPMARARQAAAPWIRLAWRVFGGVLVGAGAGWLVDGRVHSSPWGLIIGIFVGLGAGFYGLTQGLNTMNKR